MARKKRNKIRNRQRAQPQAVVEDRRAEVVTVAWMLCVLATLLAEIAGGAMRLVFGSSPDLPLTVRVLPDLLLLSALLTGLVSLILLLLAYRLRRTRPPSVVTAFSAVVALIPLAVCFLYTFR